MTNKREPITDIDISVAGSLAMGYKIVAQLRDDIEPVQPEPSNDRDFNPNDSGPLITSAVAGKTVKDVVIDNERMDDYLVFNFTDGTSLRIRYDYIYEWSLAASE